MSNKLMQALQIGLSGRLSMFKQAPGLFMASFVLAVGLGVEAAAAQTVAWITRLDNKISLIDVSSRDESGPPLEGTLNGANQVVISPDSTRAYVVNGQSSQHGVVVFSTYDQTLMGPKELPPYIDMQSAPIIPGSLVLTSDGLQAYVSNRDGFDPALIDTTLQTFSILSTSIGFDRYQGISITPDDSKLYLANYVSDHISEVTIASLTFRERIKAPEYTEMGASHIVINGTDAYVTNHDSGTVSVFDTSDNSVITTIVVGGEPFGLALTPDGRQVYVATGGNQGGLGFAADQVAVIDTASKAVTTVPVGSRPMAVAVTPDGSQAWVVNFGSGDISVIDTASNEEVVFPRIPAGVMPTWIDFADLAPPDSEGPVTSAVTPAPSPASVSEAIVVTATIDDTGRGDSDIAAAGFEVRDETAVVLAAIGDNSVCFNADFPCPTDILFDSVTEDMEVTVQAEDLGPGVYDACVRGSDAEGQLGNFTCSFLVIYDPDGGFVTGGGWIDSPAGACGLSAVCESAEGKANFGFVSKYKVGASVPTGNTAFQFKAGDLKFKSSEYEWLVIGGPQAQYKGSGTINGSGDYGFLLTAKDSAINGGPPDDTFRIKLWDKSNGDGVVYDNGSNQSIAGGSIVIHK